GAMVAFSGAADAVAAAVRMQQAIERRNRDSAERLDLRVGVSLGDLAVEDDDMFGMAVNEAARLCALAGPGEIACSDVVRAGGGARLAHELIDGGEVELKGLPAPTRVWLVAWEPADEVRVPFPSLLETAGAMNFCGRDEQLAALERGWRGALDDRSKTV